jgi:hypothetical protein
MNDPVMIIPVEDTAEFNRACDALEIVIAAEQNADYASKLAQELLDFEAAIVLAEYLRTK